VARGKGMPSMMIGFGIRVSALPSTHQIDVTMDDPTGVFPSPAGSTIFSASAVGQVSQGPIPLKKPTHRMSAFGKN
jgi:hypothetical protein